MDLRSLAPVRTPQLGLWTRGQADEVGIGRATLIRWVAAGHAIEVWPGVYAEPGPPRPWETRALGAQLWAGGDAVLARQSAARLHGLRLPRRETIDAVHLLVHSRSGRREPGLLVHRSSRPTATTSVPVGAHRVTTVERTIVELAQHVTARELRSMVGHALRTGSTTATALREAARHLGRVRGVAQLHHLLDEVSPLEARTRSELESLFLRVMSRVGLGPTALNHPVRDSRGDRRLIDAVYLPEHVPVELDSRQEHGTLLDWHDDLQRENRITLAGRWRPFLRFSWWHLTNDPADVVAQLSTALRAAGTTRPLPA